MPNPFGQGPQINPPSIEQMQSPAYFNPQNVLLFQKINSYIDIEMQQLRTQA
jgi:hypothetical protein